MRPSISECAFSTAIGATVSRGLWRSGSCSTVQNGHVRARIDRYRARCSPCCSLSGAASSASSASLAPTSPSAASDPTTASPSYSESSDGLSSFDDGSEAEFVAGAAAANMRLDKALSQRFPRSRSYFHGLIDGGLVCVNGTSAGVAKSRKLDASDVVRVTFTTPERERPLEPEPVPLAILYEDEHLAVLDKPAGLVVHPAPGNWTGTVAHGLAHRYAELAADAGSAGGGGARPGIVHRLDKGTSGALVVARTAAARDGLGRLFAAREVRKDYLAVTVGSPGGAGARAGAIDAPIGRDPRDRLRMAVVAEADGGRAARTTFRVLGTDAGALLHLVHVEIESGRTHQIRVHMRHRRAPVLGDALYGAPDLNRRFRAAAPRPMLHAARVAFAHPVTGEPVDVRAPLPPDFRKLVARAIDPALLARDPEWAGGAGGAVE